MKLKNLLNHLETIRKHRKYVRKACFKMGITWLGIIHDLSKYSLVELSIARYYTGKGSPHEECRRQTGYSKSWPHHKYKNKHHWQYWLDDAEDGGFIGIKMPYKYVIEMFCDLIGAGKAYNKERWTSHAPLDYWNNKCEGKRIMHPTSEFMVKKLLLMMDELGEKQFYIWYKNNRKSLKSDYKYKIDFNK